jgi:hypothetical protein
MKKIKFLLSSLAVVLLTIVSCTKEEAIEAADTNAVVASVAIDASNEIDFKTGMQVALDNTSAKSTLSAKTSSLVGNCAVVTMETPTANAFPKIFYVDFGTGCTVSNITRKGKLKITISNYISVYGSTMKIERENYYINGSKIEGIVNYVNETTSSAIPQWTRTVTDGKLTDKDGNIFLNSGSHTMKQTEGALTPLSLDDNVYEMTQGHHTITKENGSTLTLTVLEPLVKKYSCEYISKGKLELKGEFLNGVVDYGAGDCDAKYTYTHENGLVFNLNM